MEQPKNLLQICFEKGADIIVMIHPDYQYDPKVIKYLVSFLEEGYADVMLGSRIRSRRGSIEGGMPRINIFQSLFVFWENVLSGYNLSEWHTGNASI